MAELVAFVAGKHEPELRELWTAYLTEPAADLAREFGFVEDIPAVVAETLDYLTEFAPPAGRLLLIAEDGAMLGCGCLRRSAARIAEIKRMHVRPEARGRGLGRMLLEALLAAARVEDDRKIRLDTDGLMPAAVALSRSAGFEPCPPDPEREIPATFHARWLVLRRDLTGPPLSA